MPISSRLLERANNRCVIAPSWATLNDWLEILATEPIATPLVDFGKGGKYRVGVSSLNWYLMDLLGLRTKWLTEGWQSRSELWLLINPLRYRLLGHQPKRPYPLDVQDYLCEHYPALLNYTLKQHPYFAYAPTLYRDEVDDLKAEREAANAPWGRVAVLDEKDDIIGMVWSIGERGGNLPPLMGRPIDTETLTGDGKEN